MQVTYSIAFIVLLILMMFPEGIFLDIQIEYHAVGDTWWQTQMNMMNRK